MMHTHDDLRDCGLAPLDWLIQYGSKTSAATPIPVRKTVAHSIFTSDLVSAKMEPAAISTPRPISSGSSVSILAADLSGSAELLDGNGKPPHSYVTLIAKALLSSPDRKLTLREIYDYLRSEFPYFQTCDSEWKNCVRHNLSLNKCFVRLVGEGCIPSQIKGAAWTFAADAAEFFAPDGTHIRPGKSWSGRSNSNSSSAGGHGDNSQPLPRRVRRTSSTCSTSYGLRGSTKQQLTSTTLSQSYSASSLTPPITPPSSAGPPQVTARRTTGKLSSSPEARPWTGLSMDSLPTTSVRQRSLSEHTNAMAHTHMLAYLVRDTSCDTWGSTTSSSPVSTDLPLERSYSTPATTPYSYSMFSAPTPMYATDSAIYHHGSPVQELFDFNHSAAPSPYSGIPHQPDQDSLMSGSYGLANMDTTLALSDLQWDAVMQTLLSI